MDNTCYKKELGSLDFKAVSMNSDDYAYSYVKSENEIPLDQPEFYLGDSKEHLKTLLEDERVCQLCKQICTHGFRPIKNLKSDLIRNLYIPEVNFSSSNEPVVCSSCLHSLNADTHFLESSPNVQDKIANTLEENGGPSYINIEDMKIKTEADDVGNTPDRHTEPLEDQTSQSRQTTHDSPPVHHHPTYQNSPVTHKHPCHKLEHKNPSEVEMYKSENCSYESKHNRNHAQHRSVRKDPLQVRMYTCDTCAYKTRFKSVLARHELVHKDASEVQMYTCDTCGYQTKYKSYLAEHRLLHADPSQVRMYTCEECPYESTRIQNVQRHQLKHKKADAMPRYRCPSCSYETRFKDNLARHQFIHKDVSETHLYSCSSCSFVTRYENCLVDHEVMHRNQVRMYKCERCDYKTKYEPYFAHHQAEHTDGTEVRMYKIDASSFEGGSD